LLALVADHVDGPDGDAAHRKAAVEQDWLEQWTRNRTRDEPVR
jgi:hypothetical protein